MNQEFDELYAEYYADDRETMESTGKAKLEPTSETVEYLSIAYDDMGRGSYLQHFEESKENFILPLDKWMDWFESKSQQSIDIHSITAHLQGENGVTLASKAFLFFELDLKSEKNYVMFIGREFFESLLREYESIDMIEVENKELISLNSEDPLNVHLIQNVLMNFVEMNFSAQIQLFMLGSTDELRFIEIDSLNDFDKNKISDKFIGDAHFIMWYQ